MTAMLQSVTDRPREFSAGLRHLRRRQRAAESRDDFAPHLVGTYSGIVPDGIADLEVGDIDWVGIRWSWVGARLVLGSDPGCIADLPDSAGLISGHDSPHSPTQHSTFDMTGSSRSHRTGLHGFVEPANRTGPRKSPRPLSPMPRCDNCVATRPAAVMTDRPAVRRKAPAQQPLSAPAGMRAHRHPTCVSQRARNWVPPCAGQMLDKTHRSEPVLREEKFRRFRGRRRHRIKCCGPRQ
jgi:hypothetical protein